jgi:hypothetical protein
MHFTKHDRENIIKLNAVEGTLKVMVNQMAAHKRPSDWLKALRMAHTWSGKANQMMADCCTDDELKKVWKYFNTYEIKLMPGYEAKQIMDQEDLVTVSRDGLNDMACAILELKCDGCSITDHNGCKFKRALQGALIPAWEEPIPAEQCPYKYNSEEMI